ncbi:hypothetical protein BVRB_2g039650 [Beta vulgaris subsp. vulgaris]|nr:hypothetical protein BVRB_2g039650 [Beta vulgaris subsp. vulgaris]
MLPPLFDTTGASSLIHSFKSPSTPAINTRSSINTCSFLQISSL